MFKMFLPRLILFRKEVVQLCHAFFAPETPLYLKAATLFVAFYLVNPLWKVEPFSPISVAFTASMFFWTFISWCALYFAIRYEEELKGQKATVIASRM